jgi:pilus assembly protein CpaC
LSTLALVASTPLLVRAQAPEQQGIMFNVQGANQRLEMIVNTSRILTLDQKIPTAQVSNREVLDLTALSATQIQVFAKKTGVTQINLWNERNEIRTVDVVVYGDARELEMVLKAQFPRASLTVTPLANSVIVGGWVDRPDQVSRIVRIAEDYHPNIINNITVGGVQQVLLDVRVVEVSRTKLRTLGVDWAYYTNGDFAVSSVSGLISAFSQSARDITVNAGAETFTFGLVGENSAFFGVIEAMAQDNVAKIVADPKLVTVSGRPARFLQGGEFPVLVPQSLGTVSVEYRPYGTELDFVPIVMGNGVIRLELRPRVSEPDPGLSVTINGTTVPALTIREVDTGVEMRAGQTLAIAGLVQTRSQVEKRGIPWLKDVPYLGVVFSRKTSRENEVETLIMVTPQLVAAMDCQQVPPCGPGTTTTVPNDWELYLKQYVEVPKCCPPGGEAMGPGYGPELPPGAVHPGALPPGAVHPGALPPGAIAPGMVLPNGAEEVQPSTNPSVTPLPSVKPATPPETDKAPQASAVRRSANGSAASQSASSRPNGSPAAVRRATPPQGVSARPASTTLHNRNNPPEPRVKPQSSTSNSAPGFIGPTGYDVQ